MNDDKELVIPLPPNFRYTLSHPKDCWCYTCASHDLQVAWHNLIRELCHLAIPPIVWLTKVLRSMQ